MIMVAIGTQRVKRPQNSPIMQFDTTKTQSVANPRGGQQTTIKTSTCKAEAGEFEATSPRS